MKKKILWTRKASNDIVSIYRYIAKDSKNKAHEVYNELKKRSEELGKQLKQNFKGNIILGISFFGGK